jgi:hypothetical protein
LGYLGGLWVVDEDRETAKDDSLDFEEVLRVDPDWRMILAL